MQLALLVNCGGMLVAYLVVMRDLVHGAVHQFRAVAPPVAASQPAWHSVENVALAALVVCVLGPLVSFRYVTTGFHHMKIKHHHVASPIRRLRAVASASAFGLLALAAWTLLTSAAVVIVIARGTAQPLQWLPADTRLWELLQQAAAAVPVLLVAYICQYRCAFDCNTRKWVKISASRICVRTS